MSEQSSRPTTADATARDGLLVGVDGGNSKTEALVARPDGTVIGASRVTGCADIYQATTPEAAVDLVTRAMHDALVRASAAEAPVDVAAFSMAGADWPEDIAFLTDMLEKRRVARRVVVVNDGIGALWAGLPEGVGVVVAMGTGAATGARGPDGRTWHSSFWQGPNGARDLSEKALEAAYRAELGIDPPTTLTERLPTALGLPHVEAVLHAMTGRGQSRPPVDSLAAVVLDEAEAGDTGAARVATEHGRALGDYAVAAARRVSIDLEMPFTLVVTGGVFRHPGRVLREALVGRVRELAPRVVVGPSGHQPVVGALRLAFQHAALSLPNVEQRLEESLASVEGST